MQRSEGLAITNLNFSFSESSFVFFKNLTVSFSGNAMHFVKGRNGVGKSTFFRLLQAKVNVSEIISGDITVDDVKYSLGELHSTAQQIEEIKMVQQKFDQMLADQLTFMQNLKLANLPVYPLFASLPIHQDLPSLISQFNIDMNCRVHRLSGGQRQILAILMALQKPTKVLLLDEPTAALDEKNTDMVMNFLHELITSTGLTIIIICHDKEVIERYASGGYYRIVLNDQSHQRDISFSSEAD